MILIYKEYRSYSDKESVFVIKRGRWFLIEKTQDVVTLPAEKMGA